MPKYLPVTVTFIMSGIEYQMTIQIDVGLGIPLNKFESEALKEIQSLTNEPVQITNLTIKYPD